MMMQHMSGGSSLRRAAVLFLAVWAMCVAGLLAGASQAHAEAFVWSVSSSRATTNAESETAPSFTTTPFAQLADTYYFNLQSTSDVSITYAEVRVTPSGKAMQTLKSETYNPGVGYLSVGYTFPYEGAYSYSWYIRYTTASGASATKTCAATSLYARDPISNIKNATVTLNKTSFYYDGKAHKPTVTVESAGNFLLQKGTDYTVSYSSGCKNPGKYKVTVKGKGYFSGTQTFTFSIKLKPPTISKCSKITVGGKKGEKITWKKTPGSGITYKVQYSTVKTFDTALTQTTKKALKRTYAQIGPLKQGTTYYVRVKATKGKSSVYSAVKSFKR